MKHVCNMHEDHPLCEFATSWGSCAITGCVKQWRDNGPIQIEPQTKWTDTILPDELVINGIIYIKKELTNE